MPLYDFRCDDGHRFERLVPLAGAAVQECPACGGASAKVPTAGALLGRASAGLSKDEMPQTWRGTHHGNREYLSQLKGQWASRQRLEAKYPELAGDQRPILAHEGRYQERPLRAGDAQLSAAPAAAASHGHGHPNSHGHTHGATGASGDTVSKATTPKP